MGVDKSYGSGYKNTGKSKKTATRRQMSAAEKSLAKSPRATNKSPFRGTDPFSKTAAIAWGLPGAIAKGFDDVATGRRKISTEDLTGLAATAGLTALGYAAARTGAGRRAIKSVKPVAPRVDAAATRLSKASRAALTANQLQTDYHLRRVDDAMSDYYSAKARPNSTRGEMNNPVFREMNARASANRTRKAAEAIQESGRLDSSVTGTRILGRLQNFQNIKKRRGGR